MELRPRHELDAHCVAAEHSLGRSEQAAWVHARAFAEGGVHAVLAALSLSCSLSWSFSVSSIIVTFLNIDTYMCVYIYNHSIGNDTITNITIIIIVIINATVY